MTNGLHKQVAAIVKIPSSISTFRASCLRLITTGWAPKEGIWKTTGQEILRALSLASGWPGHGLCPL